MMSSVFSLALSEDVITYNSASGRYVCNICKKEVCGVADVETHLNGSKHREAGAKYVVSSRAEAPKSLISLLSPQGVEAAQSGTVFVNDRNAFECQICSVTLSGVVPMNSHLVSEDHKKKAARKGVSESKTRLALGADFRQLPNSFTALVQDHPPARCKSLSVSPTVVPKLAVTASSVREEAPYLTTGPILTSFQGTTATSTPLKISSANTAPVRVTSTVSILKPPTTEISALQTPRNAARGASTYHTPAPEHSSISTPIEGQTPTPVPCSSPHLQVSGCNARVSASLRFEITEEERKNYFSLIGVEALPEAPPSSTKKPVVLATTKGEDELDRVFREKVVVETDNISEKYSCLACDKRFNSAATLSDHLKSKKHKKKEAEFEELSRRMSENERSSPAQESSNEGSTKGKYPVATNPRGHVYVFNNHFKTQPSPRRGAEFDSRNIKDTFSRMGYEVFLCEDLTAKETLEAFRKIREKPALGRVDSLIIFILSHGGDPYTFKANDGEEIGLKAIRFSFTDCECPNMRGKPKIFFTNYCRGNQMEKREYDGATNSMAVPSDMVTIHAAIEGIMALRKKSCGTVFVKSLCKVLARYARNMDLRDLYEELGKEMKSNNGTKPMWEDYGFKKFCFNPV